MRDAKERAGLRAIQDMGARRHPGVYALCWNAATEQGCNGACHFTAEHLLSVYCFRCCPYICRFAHIQDMDSAGTTLVFTFYAGMRLQSEAAMGLAISLLNTC